MSRIRLRNKKMVIAGSIGAVSMLVICLIVGILYTNALKNKYVNQRLTVEQQLADTQSQLSENTVAVPVVTKDVAAGQKILSDELVTVQISKKAVPDGVVLNPQDLDGKIAKINLPAKSPVTSLLVYDDQAVTKDERNAEFSLIELPLKLQKDQYVDVRIKFPSGQDYIVLSKKKVEDLSAGTVWYHMDEKEILNMSGAIVDAYMHDATIYALSYIEPGLQDKAVPTYAPNKDVLDLISTDPNIVDEATQTLERQTREKLEKSLNSLSPQDLQKYNSAVTNHNSQQQKLEQSQDTSNNMQDNSLIGQTEVKSSDIDKSNQIFTDTKESVSSELEGAKP